jgi:single-strand DNA-binding protein
MANEAFFSVAGYIATEPLPGVTHSGVPTLSMRLAWTPRRLDKNTGEWADEPSCFATVKCFRKVAENARMSLHKGEPVVVSGTLRIREYDAKEGGRRTTVDVIANSIGHDLTRGVASFSRLRRSVDQSGAEREDAESTPADEADESRAGAGLADLAPPDEDIDEIAEVAAEEPATAPF